MASEEDVRQKRPQLPELRLSQLRKIAESFYIEGKTKKWIAKNISGGRTQVQVAKILDDLQKKTNVVAIDIDETYGLTGVEKPEKNAALREAFKLRATTVIDATEVIKAVNLDREARGLKPLAPGLETDSVVHLVLADATAERTLKQLTSEKHIAVGSGRAVFRCCEWIWRKRPSLQGVLITPLTARIWAGNWQIGSIGLLEAPLDADDAAHLLALAFRHGENEAGARFSRFGYPIYTQTPKAARFILERYSPLTADGGFGRVEGVVPATPQMAFVGVGVLHKDSGHRIARFLYQSRDFPTPIDPVREEIMAAMKLVETHKLPPIGDIANRLFLVLPLPSELSKWSKPVIAKQLNAYHRLASILKRLNDHAIVCRWTHLRKIESVRIIAGSRMKAPALWTILIADVIRREKLGDKESFQRIAGEITIDMETSDLLLEERKVYDKNPTLKDLYVKFVEELELFEEPELRRLAKN